VPDVVRGASKHVRVLERAGLVRRTVRGRTHNCRLEPKPLADAQAWLAFYQRYWTARLDALEAMLAPPARSRPSAHDHPHHHPDADDRRPRDRGLSGVDRRALSSAGWRRSRASYVKRPSIPARRTSIAGASIVRVRVMVGMVVGTGSTLAGGAEHRFERIEARVQ